MRRIFTSEHSRREAGYIHEHNCKAIINKLIYLTAEGIIETVNNHSRQNSHRIDYVPVSQETSADTYNFDNCRFLNTSVGRQYCQRCSYHHMCEEGNWHG